MEYVEPAVCRRQTTQYADVPARESRVLLIAGALQSAPASFTELQVWILLLVRMSMA